MEDMEHNKKHCPYCNEMIDSNLTVCPICCETLSNYTKQEEYHCPFCNEVIDPTENVCPICCETLTSINTKLDNQDNNTHAKSETNIQEHSTNVIAEYRCPFCNEIIDTDCNICPICGETISSYSDDKANNKENSSNIAPEIKQIEQIKNSYKEISQPQNNMLIILLSSLLIISAVIILFLIISKSRINESNETIQNNIQTKSADVSQKQNKISNSKNVNKEGVKTKTVSKPQDDKLVSKSIKQEESKIVKQTTEDEITIYKKNLAKRLDANWHWNPVLNEDLTAIIECHIGRNGKVNGVCKVYKSSGKYYYDSQAESYMDGTICLNPMPLPQSFTENELIIKHALTYKAPKTQQVIPNNSSENTIKQNDIKKSTDELFE